VGFKSLKKKKRGERNRYLPDNERRDPFLSLQRKKAPKKFGEEDGTPTKRVL